MKEALEHVSLSADRSSDVHDNGNMMYNYRGSKGSYSLDFSS